MVKEKEEEEEEREREREREDGGGILSVWFFVGRTSPVPPLSPSPPRGTTVLCTPAATPSLPPYRSAIAHGMAPFSVSVT